MRGIESIVVYPALISFGLTAMKACTQFLRSVNSSSGVSSFLPERGLASFNSCNQAWRGYTAWAHPILFLPSPCSLCRIWSGSVSCDIWTRVGNVQLMASRRVGYPVVVSWPSVFIMNVSCPSNRMVISFPSADTSMVCVLFHSSLCCMWTRCWIQCF